MTTVEAAQQQLDPNRWKALRFLALIQFMLVLDTTVVNVALPRIQSSLHFTAAGLPWVVNGYVVMAGGLLLLGGRTADLVGRRAVFLTGVALFGIASATCGAAINPAMLVTSRFVQGVAVAMASPAALGLIALMFSDTKERRKALGIWGGIAGIAGVLGTVISGLFTDFISWRAIFYVNLPVCLVALYFVPRLVRESRSSEVRGLDAPAAIASAAGLIAIVYGLLQAVSHSWGSSRVLLPLLGGLVLLLITAGIETVSKAPLFPPAFFANRTRVAANVITLLLAATFFAYIFLLTLFEQQILHYSPLRGGLSYLPFGVAIGIGVGASMGALGRFGARITLVVGLIGCAVGIVIASRVTADSSYLTAVVPGMVIFGLFSGFCMPATTTTALHEVTERDSGLGAGIQNAMNQIGGGLGLAVLVALAYHKAAHEMAHRTPGATASADGLHLALVIGAGILVVGAVIAFAFLGAMKAAPRTEPAAEPAISSSGAA